MASMHGTYGTTMFMCVYYIIIGFIACLCNFLNLRIYSANGEMRKRYIYFIAFEVGELINSISFIMTGIGRMTTLLNGTITMPITAHQCFYERWWVHVLILGTEVPTLILVLISIERICVVVKPALYNHLFSTIKRKSWLLFGTVSIAIISLIAGGFSAWNNGTIVNSGHCPIISSTDQWYSTMHFLFVIFGYTIAFFSLLVMNYYRRKLARESMRLQRRDSKTNILIAFTGTSIAFVASPSVVMIGIRWNVCTPDDIIVALTYSATAMVSIANTVINFVFRDEFRRALFKGLKKIGMPSSDFGKSNLVNASTANAMTGLDNTKSVYTVGSHH